MCVLLCVSTSSFVNILRRSRLHHGFAIDFKRNSLRHLWLNTLANSSFSLCSLSVRSLFVGGAAAGGVQFFLIGVYPFWKNKNAPAAAFPRYVHKILILRNSEKLLKIGVSHNKAICGAWSNFQKK